MKKKSSLILGMLAALLAFSLVLTGCPDPNKDDDGSETGIPAAMVGSWTASGPHTLLITATTAQLDGGSVLSLTGVDSSGGIETYQFGGDAGFTIFWGGSTIGTIWMDDGSNAVIQVTWTKQG